MERRLRPVFWIETGLAALTGLLCVITPFWPDWIEAISGWDPDQHDGSVEWMIATGLLALTVILGAAAMSEWRRVAAPADRSPPMAFAPRTRFVPVRGLRGSLAATEKWMEASRFARR